MCSWWHPLTSTRSAHELENMTTYIKVTIKFPTISAQYQHTYLAFVVYSQMTPGWLFVSNNSLSQNNCSRSNKYWHHYYSRRRFTWTVRCSDALNPSRRSRSRVPLPVCSIISYLIIPCTALHTPLDCTVSVSLGISRTPALADRLRLPVVTNGFHFSRL